MIKQTTALRKISHLKKPIKVVQGGQGAGKTISILILLINHASNTTDKEILILSAELSKMRFTVIKDFVKMMKMSGLYKESQWIGGTLYRFPNGSFIKFIGLDKSDVGKGLRSDIAYFNEVNKINSETYRQVASRAKKVFADYNPDAKFFIHKEIIGRKDVDYLELTFKDNEMLPDREREEILRYKEQGYDSEGNVINEYWANKWRVYGLGLTGKIDGVVFQNWSQIDAVPSEAELIGYGMDFGFTNDPTTLIALYKYDGKIIVDEMLYEKGLVPSQIAKAIKEDIEQYKLIYADSASPSHISELQTFGLPIHSVKKPEIKESIHLMQEYEWLITSRSKNTIEEFYSYKWKLDKTGESLNVPIDNWNHTIDAIRYCAWMNLVKTQFVDDFDIEVYT